MAKTASYWEIRPSIGDDSVVRSRGGASARAPHYAIFSGPEPGRVSIRPAPQSLEGV